MRLSRSVLAGCLFGAQAWTGSAAAAGAPAASPGDDAMTCEQIAVELTPYIRQMTPSIQAYAGSLGQLNQQSRAMGEKRKAEEEAIAAAAAAGAVDPTGASKRAYQAAVIAQHAKEERENKAMLDSELAQRNKVQGEQFASQARQMQSDARLQHLMQLMEQKHCGK